MTDATEHRAARTYLVMVRIDAPDDRIGLRAAHEVANHIRDHYRHDTLKITVGDVHRVSGTVPRRDEA